MRKLLAAALAIGMLAILVTAAPVVRATGDPGEETGVLVSHVDMAYSPDWGYWRGTINGPLHGTIGFWEGPALIQNGIDYFSESFVITTSKGVITGTDEGLYDLTTGDFWAHGMVTGATGRWASLIGCTAFEWGTTTTPFVFPMIATHMPFVLTPPQPTPAHDHEVAVTYSDMAFGDWGYWRGSVSGDMQGTEQIWEKSNYLIGTNLYFFENATIRTQQGVVEIQDHGVFNVATGDFWAYGQSTAASGRWHFLEGYTFLGFGNVAGVGGAVMTSFAPSILLDT